MTLFGIPVFAWIGFLLFLMITFQVLTGRRIIKVNLKYHRCNGHAIIVLAIFKLFLWLLEDVL
jgi:hypothetical protein